MNSDRNNNQKVKGESGLASTVKIVGSDHISDVKFMKTIDS